MENLIFFFLSSTGFGALIAFSFYKDYKSQWNKTNFSNKFKKRMSEGKLSKVDYSNLYSAYYCIVYLVGCFLIALPGFLTDLLGVLLVIPHIRKLLTSKYGMRNLEQYQVQKHD